MKTKKAPTPHHHHAAGIVRNENGEYLIYRRPDDGMLGGLWTFPGGRLTPDESVDAACKRLLREDFGIETPAARPFHRLSHAYSHFKITLHACHCPAAIAPAEIAARGMRWVAADALRDLAFDRASRKLIDALPPPEPV